MVHRDSRFQHPRFVPTSGDLRHVGFAWGEGNSPSSVGLWIAELQLCTKFGGVGVRAVASCIVVCELQKFSAFHMRCIYQVFELLCYDLGRFVGVTWASPRPMAQFPLRWSGTTKQKSCPLLVFKPDEPLNEPYQLHVQLLYVPHSFCGINWLRRSEWVECVVGGVEMAANIWPFFWRMERYQTSHHAIV